MASHFFATISRMKYIERWALMRNARPENLSEHSLEVAMISHVLCTIGNVRYGKSLNAEKAALIALYHDASEIVTGDMPTPVKYANQEIKNAYKEIEATAEERLLAQLPEDLRPTFSEIFQAVAETEEETHTRKLVKAADKLSALIKCLEERAAGNTEFSTAEKATREKLQLMAEECPEVGDFLNEFLPSYGKTLDELLAEE